MAAIPEIYNALSVEDVRAICSIPKACHDSAYAKMPRKLARKARPKSKSDTYRATEKKVKYHVLQEKLVPREECICAISLHCPLKPEGEKECRTLAPTPKAPHAKGWPIDAPLIDTEIAKTLDKLVQTVTYFDVLAKDLQEDTVNYQKTHKCIREWLSHMRCFSVTSTILEESRVLESVSKFLLWVDQNDISFDLVPDDIRDDLDWLWVKWEKTDWDLADPLRGINVKRRGISRSLNKDWPFYNANWMQFGHNGLVLGESWRYQIAILRDGGHGSLEAGISGVVGRGATSIILSNPDARDEYADWDTGKKIGYMGTSGRRDSPSRCTKLLLDSHLWWVSHKKIKVEDGEAEGNENDLLNETPVQDEQKATFDDRPVRVFRSSRLPPHNKWRPRHGNRYDGLYDVVRKKLLDEERALYRFLLVRRKGQGAIRTDQPDDQTMLLWYQCAVVQRTADEDEDEN